MIDGVIRLEGPWLTRRKSRCAVLRSVGEAGRTGLALFVLGGLDHTPGELGERFVCGPSLVGIGLGDGFPGHLHRSVEGGVYLVGPGGLVLDEQHAWCRPPYREGDFVLLRAALVVADAPDRATQLWHVGILPSVQPHLTPRRSPRHDWGRLRPEGRERVLRNWQEEVQETPARTLGTEGTTHALQPCSRPRCIRRGRHCLPLPVRTERVRERPRPDLPRARRDLLCLRR